MRPIVQDVSCGPVYSLNRDLVRGGGDVRSDLLPSRQRLVGEDVSSGWDEVFLPEHTQLAHDLAGGARLPILQPDPPLESPKLLSHEITQLSLDVNEARDMDQHRAVSTVLTTQTPRRASQKKSTHRDAKRFRQIGDDETTIMLVRNKLVVVVHRPNNGLPRFCLECG